MAQNKKRTPAVQYRASTIVRDVRLAGWVTYTVYARVQYRETKTGQQKVQFYCEDDWL